MDSKANDSQEFWKYGINIVYIGIFYIDKLRL